MHRITFHNHAVRLLVTAFYNKDRRLEERASVATLRLL